MFCRLFQSEDAFNTLAPIWDELLSEFQGASVFSTPQWLLAWWHAFGHHHELLIFGFFDESGLLVGIAPMMLENRAVCGGLHLRILKLLGDGSGDSDNLDLPMRRGYEGAVIRCLFNWLQQHSDSWDLCELNTMPSASPAAACVSSLASALGWNSFQHKQPQSVVDLPNSWQEYIHSLAAEERRNLPRYMQRLKRRYRVRLRRCTSEDELPSALKALFDLHQLRWQSRGEPGTFSNDSRRKFYREISPALLAKGMLELWLLELDDRPAAVQFAMRYRDTVFQLQEGFHPKLSPDRVGYLLRGHVLERLISEGVRHYDFLAGRTPHKVRWMAREGHYLTIRFARAHSLEAAYASLAHHSHEAKARLRTCLPPRAWKVLHQVNLMLSEAEGDFTRASESVVTQAERSIGCEPFSTEP